MSNIEAHGILECMVIDMTGALASMRESDPMACLLEQRIEAINLAKEALKQTAGISDYVRFYELRGDM